MFIEKIERNVNMALQYNLDFLYVALIVSLLIFGHFKSQPSPGNVNDRIFAGFFAIGITDILFDIITTQLIMHQSPSLRWPTMICLTIFYLMQVAVPSAFLCYVLSLKQDNRLKVRHLLMRVALPAGAMTVLVLINFFTGIIFTIDPQGFYVSGPLFYLLYGYAIVCCVVGAVWSLINIKSLSIRRFIVVWEFILICAVCVLIQAFHHEILTTGLGICLGLTALYLYVNDPSTRIDRLTGAWDKQSLNQWLQEQMNYGRRLHLIAVELYSLKSINRLYGDRLGDRVLTEVAKRLRRTSGSYLFRLGSGRFFLIVSDLKEYHHLCLNLQNMFQQKIVIGEEKISCPAILCGIPDAQQLKDPGDLLAYERHLYKSTSADGKTVFRADDEEARQAFRYEKEVERYLNTAIENDLFQLYFQPVWSLEAKQYVSLEALSRLHHPDLGMIPPDIFIDIAERNGQMAHISQLQLARLCRFVHEHRDALSTLSNIKFNLSPLELTQEGHAKRLIEIVHQHGIDPNFIQFEITETAASSSCDALINNITAFSDAGIRLCLDDFGSGYANLNTVLKMPFCVIKLDRSLLFGICSDPQVATFYKNIVDVLQKLDYLVVSEGVKNQDELELIESWGVQLVQGFYFSPPLPPKEVLNKIQS